MKQDPLEWKRRSRLEAQASLGINVIFILESLWLDSAYVVRTGNNNTLDLNTMSHTPPPPPPPKVAEELE
jgi:hypothetical protein